MGNGKMPILLGFYECGRFALGICGRAPQSLGPVGEPVGMEWRQPESSHWATVPWAPPVQDNASGMTLSLTHRPQARSLTPWSWLQPALF